MVTILQSFRQPNPIADGIRNAAGAIFGDTLTPALKRQRLEQDAREEENLELFAQGLPPELRAGVLSGLSASDVGGFRRQQGAANVLSAGGDLLRDPTLNSLQLGAGQAASSTGLGFLEGESNAADRNALSARTSAGATVSSAQIRAAQQAESDRLRLEENARQFNQTPQEVIVDGQPVLVPRANSFDEGVLRDQSTTDTQGQLLRENFPALGALTPRQATTLGALPSETNVRGDVLAQALGANPPDLAALPEANLLEAAGLGAPSAVAAQTALRFQSRDGSEFFTSTDGGITDNVTGLPIPQDAIRLGSTNPVTVGDSGGATPTTTNDTALFQQQAALRDFQDTSRIARAIANGPNGESLFGVGGLIRAGVQGVGNVARTVDALFGGEGAFEQRIASAQAQILDPSTDPAAREALLPLFDPSIDAITRITTLLVYQGASALAGQEGRGLSDRDVKIFQGVFGNPRGFFSSRDTFITGLDLADQIVAARQQAGAERREGEFSDAPLGAPSSVIEIDENGNIIR